MWSQRLWSGSECPSFHPPCAVLCCALVRIELANLFIILLFLLSLGNVRIPATSTGLFCQSSMIFARIKNFDRKRNAIAAMRYSRLSTNWRKQPRHVYMHTSIQTLPTCSRPRLLLTKIMATATKAAATSIRPRKTKLLITEGNRERASGTARFKGYLISPSPALNRCPSVCPCLCVWVHRRKVSRVFHVHKIPFCLRR